MEQKEQDNGLDQYKGLAKPLIKIVSSILFLMFLYLAYTPTDIEPDNLNLAAGDWVFLLALAALLIAAIVFYYSPKQLLFSLRATGQILDNHPRGAYISFFVYIGIAVAIIAFLIGFSSSLAKVLARLASPEEPLNIRNILLGFAGITGLCLAAWRSRVLDRQAKTMEQRRDQDSKELKIMEQRRVDERRAEERNEERRFDERFANAVKSLSQELNETSYPAHLGAIVALRDLAMDNNNYTQRCLDILCSCNQWMEGYLDKFSCNYDTACFADIHLTANNRIVPIKSNKGNLIKLEHERRSQQSLSSVATILDKISKKDNAGYKIKNIDLSGKTLCGINLHEHEISGINLNNAYLNGANLRLANMQGAKLTNAHLRRAYIGEANLQGANMMNANMEGTDLMLANLQNATLHETNLQRTDLNNANLQGATLIRSNLKKAQLFRTNLQGVNMAEANLQGAQLAEVYLQNADLTKANLQGVKLTDAQLDETTLVSANLQEVNIRGIDAKGANFNDANLEGANLSDIDAKGSTFVGANLKGAYLRESDLPKANLTNADLYAANLTEAYIPDANFHNANIQKATLVGANITGSNLTGANLTESDLQGISIEKTNCRSTIFNQAKMHAVDFIDCDLRGAMFISSELQSASFNESNLEKCTLLGCNLYGVEIKNNKLQNIIFDAISDTGHIKTKGTRNTWIKGIGKGLIDSTNDEERISRIQQAWNKTDKEEMPKGLNALQQASILEKDAKDRWVIMPAKVEELKEFYRKLITESDKGLFIPISDAMDIISKSHEPLSKNYPEMQKTLKAILDELAEEFMKEG